LGLSDPVGHKRCAPYKHHTRYLNCHFVRTLVKLCDSYWVEFTSMLRELGCRQICGLGCTRQNFHFNSRSFLIRFVKIQYPLNRYSNSEYLTGLNEVSNIHGHLVNLGVVVLLDVGHHSLVLFSHKVDRNSLTTETSGATNSVNVVFSVAGEVIVDD